MECIVLTHLSGSKANQEDRFSLCEFKEITLGRDPSSSVKYEDETGTVVGRQHARITRNPALPHLFFITDLNSRNGTFVNGQRINGRAGLKPGDLVQCGIGGPAFRFRIELETESRTEDRIPPAADPPEQLHPQPARPDLPLAASSGAALSPAGDVYVERSAVPRSRKPLIVGGGVFMGLVALATGILLYRGGEATNSSEAGKPVATPQQTAVSSTPAAEATPVAAPAMVTTPAMTQIATPTPVAAAVATRPAITARRKPPVASRPRIAGATRPPAAIKTGSAILGKRQEPVSRAAVPPANNIQNDKTMKKQEKERLKQEKERLKQEKERLKQEKKMKSKP
jgi:hypothetical protein